MVGDGWDWVVFGQAVFANGIVAIVLAIFARALQREQDRAEREAVELVERAQQESAERGRFLGYAALPLAVSGWSGLPDETGRFPAQESVTPKQLKELKATAEQWRKVATELETLRESRPERDAGPGERHEAGKSLLIQLGTLSNRLVSYLMEGGRRRRLIYLRWLADDLAAAASAGWKWSPSVYRFRNAAVVFFGWVQHTHTTIVERLLVERVTHLIGPPPAGNLWLDSDDTTGLADAAVNTDPVYLLVFYVNRAVARIKKTREYSDAVPLIDLVARSLGALRNEMRAAADCGDALLAVAQEAQAQPTNPR